MRDWSTMLAAVSPLVAVLGVAGPASASARPLPRPPLNLSDGTTLPQPFSTDAQLDARKAELRKRYEPFTRNLTPPAPFHRPVTELSSSGVWLFRDDPDDWGELKRWFAADASENGWTRQAIPDYREFARGWYRTKFDAPTWKADRVILRFEGVDYSARVFLNETYLGEHTGYFAPFEFDVTELLKPTGNVLAIRVDNPVCWSGQQDSFQGDGMGTLAFNENRKVMQFSNGAGVYQPVKLVGRSHVHIDRVRVTPRWPDTAQVEACIVNTTSSPAVLNVEVNVVPRNFGGDGARSNVTARVSKQNVEAFSLKLAGTRLWTPDTPYLYTARVTVTDGRGEVLDCVDEPFGMRWFEQNDEGGFLLNKEPFFVRGSGAFGNFWLPSVNQDTQAIVNDILLFKAANLDMARPHLHILPEIAYEYMDMYGLMVYTDMPLNGPVGSAGRSDSTPLYSEEMKRQARDMVNHLYNHPSIVIWQVANESQSNAPVAAQIPPTLKEIVRVLREIDPTRLQVAASGFTAPMGGGNKEWWGLSDDHWYSGCLYATTAYHEYRTDNPSETRSFTPGRQKMVTEYGAPAFPRWETCATTYPWELPPSADDLYDVRWIPCEFPYRGVPFLGDACLSTVTANYAGVYCRMSDWIAHGQDYQAFYCRHATDILRRRPDINGYIHFFLIDPGPCTYAQSIVDNRRLPKSAYFALAQASAPHHISIQSDGRRFFSGSDMRGLYAWVFNDPNLALKADIRTLIVDESGAIFADSLWKGQVISPASRSLAGQIKLMAPEVKSGRKRFFIYAILSDDSGVVDYDCLPIDVFARNAPAPVRPLAVFDAIGKTEQALRCAKIEFRRWSPGDPLADTSLLVIGAYSSTADLLKAKDDIKRYLEGGGHVLVLNQLLPGQATSGTFRPDMDYWTKVAVQNLGDSRSASQPKVPACNLDWFPVPVPLVASSNPIVYEASRVFPVGHTPLADGLSTDDLDLWSGGEQVAVECPIDRCDQADPHFSCGVWQKFSAASEVSVGAGKLMFSQLLLVDRYGVDPVATIILDRLLDTGTWTKLPDVSVSKEASLSPDGMALSAKLTIHNASADLVTGDILDNVLQDPKANGIVEPVRRTLTLKPGQTQTVAVERKLASPFKGELAPAVFVFPNGRWVTSNCPTVGVNWEQMELIKAFDFGPNDRPVAAGHTRVTPDVEYSEAAGYGWFGRETNYVAGDNKVGDPLTRYFVACEFRGRFRVFLPAGDYVFRIVAGEIDSTNDMVGVGLDRVSPVLVSCNAKPVGRLVRLVRHSPGSHTFDYRLDADGPVDISLECPYKSNFCPISFLGVYRVGSVPKQARVR